MTPALSVTFFKPELGDFLYASVGGSANDLPITVMTALSRLGLDPWQEASELTELSNTDAVDRLSVLLAKLPLEQRSLVNSMAFIVDLIELLPRHLQRTVAIPSLARPLLAKLPLARILIMAAVIVGIVFTVIATLSN